MINPQIIFGRLGNSMFQYAALYAYAKDMEVSYYFQSPIWFSKYEGEIRKLYSDGIPEMNDKVAIHVRRAANPLNPDEPKYSENPFYTHLCDTDYYQRAMALFPNEKFIVFSDDPLWCEQQEMFKDCEISWLSELEEMNMMASCKGHIIANSSFSWWSAWLCPNYPNNKVIAPKDWYADGKERTMLPPHWITL